MNAPKRRNRARVRASGWWLAAILGAGCLEPFDEGQPLVGSPFGPDIPSSAAPRLAVGEGFTTTLTRLTGFEAGASVSFVRADGEVSQFVPPAWRLFKDGAPLGAFIVDVLPGQLGYGPAWRLHRVNVTAAYAGEHIWSRAAVVEGVELGLLEPPVATDELVLAPICAPTEALKRAGFDPDARPEPVDVWYRDQWVSWVRLATSATLAPDQNQLGLREGFDFRRLGQGYTLDEAREGVDLDGDGATRSTHRLLGTGSSPICQIREVVTSTVFRSIDGAGPIEVTDADDSRLRAATRPVLGVSENSYLELCPEIAP